MKFLVARDDKRKAIFGHVVLKKRIDETSVAVDSLVEDVKWLGHTKSRSRAIMSQRA